MNAGEASGEDMPLSQQQQQQQQRSHHQQRGKKRVDEEKTSTNESVQPQQLKPSEFDRPSRSSMSSVESIEVVHVRRPSTASGRRRRHSPIKPVRQGVLIVSVILFASGLLTTVSRLPHCSRLLFTTVTEVSVVKFSPITLLLVCFTETDENKFV